MNVKEAISRADELRLNTVDEEQKAAWLLGLDGQLAELFQVPPPVTRWPEDQPLLMPKPYEEIYPLYLVCQIDYYNQEMELYANDRALYERALEEARAWYRRHHRRRGRGSWRVM